MANNRKKKSSWLWSLVVLALAAGIYFLANNEASTPTQSSPKLTPSVQGVVTNAPLNPTTQPSSGTYFEVYFTDPTNPSSNHVELALINKINQAKKSIDVAVYEFSIEEVAQALISAEKRGVVVQVVYDNEFSDPDPQIGEVIKAGIPAVPDNRSAFMHNKFFVFDNECVWTGSFNISMNAARKNNENAFYFCSPEASANYHTEFAEMFSGQFGPTSPSNTPYPVFTVNGITIENCFASEDNCMEKIINVVNTAKSSIHFMAFSFTDDNLGQAMIADARRGVSVEGIFETRGANQTYTDSKTKKIIHVSECYNLLNNGLDVRLDGNPATFHHKVIIVDSRIVIFGSFNFSTAANENNDENLLIVYDPTLAAAFEQQYQLMKSQSVKPTGDTCSK